jgi:hypothetical protein
MSEQIVYPIMRAALANKRRKNDANADRKFRVSVLLNFVIKL